MKGPPVYHHVALYISVGGRRKDTEVDTREDKPKLSRVWKVSTDATGPHHQEITPNKPDIGIFFLWRTSGWLSDIAYIRIQGPHKTKNTA